MSESDDQKNLIDSDTQDTDFQAETEDNLEEL